MKIQKVFDSTIVRVQCEQTELYNTSQISTNVEKFFNFVDYQSQKTKNITPEAVGKYISSVGKPFPVQEIPSLKPLMSWIDQQIMLVAPYFVNFSPSRFMYTRTWANKMYRGCSGKAHSHGNTKININSGVAIFYLQVPENSGDLVFITKKHEQEYMLDDYSDRETIYANVKEGELLFHDNGIMHAITEHKNDISRICLVFDFIYLP